MSNRDESNKDNPRFGNLRDSNKNNTSKDNPKLCPKVSNKNNTNINNPKLCPKVSNKDKSNTENPRFGNLRDSNARENDNASSLKETLNEGMQNIECRRTRSLKTLPYNSRSVG
jgi:hypothetical protein